MDWKAGLTKLTKIRELKNGWHSMLDSEFWRPIKRHFIRRGISRIHWVTSTEDHQFLVLSHSYLLLVQDHYQHNYWYDQAGGLYCDYYSLSLPLLISIWNSPILVHASNADLWHQLWILNINFINFIKVMLPFVFTLALSFLLFKWLNRSGWDRL